MFWNQCEGNPISISYFLLLLQEEIKVGNHTFIDPRYSTRSPEEAKLTEIIKKCYAYDPEERPSVFQLVAWLREAVSNSLGGELSRADVLRTVPV